MVSGHCSTRAWTTATSFASVAADISVLDGASFSQPIAITQATIPIAGNVQVTQRDFEANAMYGF
jgi:hypothetical protein